VPRSHPNADIMIGTKIKQFRQASPLTLDQLGDLTSLSKSFLSKIENGKTSPSIPNLLKIAQALRIGMSQLLDGLEEQGSEGPALVEAEGRPIVDRGGSSFGYSYEALARCKDGGSFEPFIVRFKLGKKPRKPFIHAGHEFNYVLQGEVEFVYGEESYLLKKGDSVCYDSSVPHYGMARGTREAQVLAILLADSG
jgi:transcriptional regulator with XRE-family HTH domain